MDEKKNSENYEVGYKKPPEKSQFKKGESGNLKGRPKMAEPPPVDVAQVLNEPITVKQGGISREVSPFEAGIRRLVSRALKDKDWNSAVAFIRLCDKHGIMEPAPSKDCGVMYFPKDWDVEEWSEMYMRYGPPPWPGDRDGLCH
jgi:hypothetical protein